MRFVGAGMIVLMASGVASAQTPPAGQPQAAPACLTQYTQVPGESASSMINAGYEIKAAVPGGLWLQKGKEVFYCNSGRPTDAEALCWRLRDPGPC